MKKRTLTAEQDQQFQQRDFAFAAWNAFLKQDTRSLQHILAVMTNLEKVALVIRAAQFFVFLWVDLYKEKENES